MISVANMITSPTTASEGAERRHPNRDTYFILRIARRVMLDLYQQGAASERFLPK
ncbi:hypothetical protein [Bradyrhizobium icense]|uniref:hypothetical protein n=1 Tax=Bradyrhizobium icense TaxID=1274631 RepID=UPI0012E9CA97|nr:hypothetical protein [Bradyrhizobium icense]